MNNYNTLWLSVIPGTHWAVGAGHFPKSPKVGEWVSSYFQTGWGNMEVARKRWDLRKED